MSQSRSDRQSPLAPSTPLLAEMLRQSAEAGKADLATRDRDEGRISVFWRIFGGTLLSIAALVAVTISQQLTANLAELRNDLNHLNADLRKELGRLSETQGDLVKKGEFAGRMRSVWDGIKEVQGGRKALTTLKERCSLLSELFKSGAEERRQLSRELQRLREQKAGADERRELVRELHALRERLATLEGRNAAAPAVHREADE
jgi:chromosome segregation ATPase